MPHNPPEYAVRTRFISTVRKQLRDEPTTPMPSLYNDEVQRQDLNAASSFPSFPSLHSDLYRHRSHTIPKVPDTSAVFGLKYMMATDSLSSLTEMLTHWSYSPRMSSFEFFRQQTPFIWMELLVPALNCGISCTSSMPDRAPPPSRWCLLYYLIDEYLPTDDSSNS